MKRLCCLLISLSLVTVSAQTMIDLRDSTVYPYVQLGDLYWMRTNLNYQTASSLSVPDSLSHLHSACGAFYLLQDIADACPEGWRLPLEEELRPLLKANRKQKINLTDTLDIPLCGRIDAGQYTRPGEQSTFWIDAQNENGHLLHWHVFGETHELHSHNVVQARRQFPIRCVKEVD